MATATAPEPEPADQKPERIPGVGREWRVGEGLTSWPLLKIAQATRHARDLETRLQIWASNDPLATEGNHSEDRTKWELRIKIRNHPPVLEWALVLGDCLHNLRSALDGLVWQLAHVEGQTPPNPRVLQFPIIRDRSKWADAKKRNLQTVPDEVAERIEMVQPFNRTADEVAKDALLLLSELNNTDKHRSNLVVATNIHGVSQNTVVAFEDPRTVQRNMPPRFTFHNAPIVDGGVVLELATLDPVESVKGKFDLAFQFMLETDRGQVEVLSTLGQLIDYVRQVGALVTTGPAQPAGEGWAPMIFRQEGDRYISGG